MVCTTKATEQILEQLRKSRTCKDGVRRKPRKHERLAAQRIEELERALEAAANALGWAERRMACPAYAEVIANDWRNALAALHPAQEQGQCITP